MKDVGLLTLLFLGMVGLCGVLLKKKKNEPNKSQYGRKYSGIFRIKLCQYTVTQHSETLMFHWKKN